MKNDLIKSLIEQAESGEISEVKCALALKKLYIEVELGGVKPLQHAYEAVRGVGICLCGKPTKFVSVKLGHKRFCSSACGTNYTKADHAEATKAGVRKKYGVDNHFQRAEVIAKIKSAREALGEAIISARRKQTCVKRYGVENVAQAEHVKQTARDTCLERYGVENAGTTHEALSKSRDTKLARYGADYNNVIYTKSKQALLTKHRVENNFQRTDSKLKIEKTLMAKYGVRHPMLSPAIKEKLLATVRERYAVDNVFQAEDVKQQIRAKLLSRYGVSYPTQNSNIMGKVKRTNLERYGTTSVLSQAWCKQLAIEAQAVYYAVPENRAVVNSKISKTTTSKNLQRYAIRFINRLEKLLSNGYSVPAGLEAVKQAYINNEEFSLMHDECQTSYNVLGRYRYRGCPKCQTSLVQSRVEGWLTEMAPAEVIIKNDRRAIKPYEIDIFLPALRVGIEVHGDYYHSSVFKSESYHEQKHLLARASGIQLIQLFEHEIEQHPEKCKELLRHKLMASNKSIGARKLSLRQVSIQDERVFFDVYHMQGFVQSKLALGLWDDNRLVACMSFGRPRFSKCDFELLRYASIGNIQGGPSKLFKEFKARHPSAKVITYADARYSTGKIYELLGFKLKHKSSPNYWYVKGGARLSRYQAQKHLLPKLLGANFDPLLTEVQNMNKNGWFRLFDCGNYVFEL